MYAPSALKALASVEVENGLVEELDTAPLSSAATRLSREVKRVSWFITEIRTITIWSMI